ncbi:helix-turn-helix domain-containing protein [Actinophytocola sp.]|uniref:helix-turn-helix domain-containing protein n=1 Tax=Actinophytocola sp. TaxID=1872138 RepID=UPI003899A493
MEFTELAGRADLGVWAARCPGGHAGWSVSEPRGDYRLVLVRRGRFRRRVAGSVVDLDPTVAYLGAPGEDESFAHPAGGDVCTSVSMSAALGERLAGAARPLVYVDARVDLAHRRLLAATSADVEYGLVEALLGLLAAAPVHARPADRTLVARAREALAADDPAASDLLSLAATLGVSPYRLSRAFTRSLGISLTHYRNRLRVGRALDRLEAGEQNLSRLAADLGFADQAHLSRTVRAHAGHTPTSLRRLLARPAESGAQRLTSRTAP